MNTPRMIADQLKTTLSTFPQLKSSSPRNWFFEGRFLRGRGSFLRNCLSFIRLRSCGSFSMSRCLTFFCFVQLVAQAVNSAQVPHLLSVVEPVPDHEVIRDDEADIVDGEADLCGVLFIEKGDVPGADLGVPVAGELHEIDLAIDIHVPDEIRHEHERAVQDPDKDGNPPLVVPAHLPAERLHARLNLLFRQIKYEAVVVYRDVFTHSSGLLRGA